MCCYVYQVIIITNLENMRISAVNTLGNGKHARFRPRSMNGHCKGRLLEARVLPLEASFHFISGLSDFSFTKAGLVPFSPGLGSTQCQSK